jgi:hypothetical protein
MKEKGTAWFGARPLRQRAHTDFFKIQNTP